MADDRTDDFGFRLQTPCPCCSFHAPVGCYAVAELPDDWRTDPRFKDSACSTEACSCWGGPDRECEDCWLWNK